MRLGLISGSSCGGGGLHPRRGRPWFLEGSGEAGNGAGKMSRKECKERKRMGDDGERGKEGKRERGTGRQGRRAEERRGGGRQGRKNRGVL
eukprot:2509037-Rhodomonas_salina.1